MSETSSIILAVADVLAGRLSAVRAAKVHRCSRSAIQRALKRRQAPDRRRQPSAAALSAAADVRAGVSVAVAAERHGVAPSTVYRMIGREGQT